MKNWLKKYDLLILILLIGLGLRIYHLGHESLWLDEAVTISGAGTNLANIFHSFWTMDYNPSLFWLILHYWMQIFGTSEFATRFLSVIFGLGDLLMVYMIGKLIFNRKIGLLATLLMALSIFHIAYSQEARMYSLLMFLSLASMYFFIELLNKKGVKYIYGYIIFSILALYSHTFGFLIIIVQNIYYFSLYQKLKKTLKLKYWILIQALLMVLILPWFILLYRQIAISDNDVWKLPFKLINLAYIVEDFAGSRLLLLIFTLSILAAVFSEISFKRLLTRGKNIFLLLLWLVVGIVTPFFISYFFASMYLSAKYSIVALPAFYLLVAKGLSNIKNKYFFNLILMAIIILASINIWSYFSDTHKDQWREAVAYIESRAETKDLLVFVYGYHQIPYDYYGKRHDLEKKSLLTNYRVLKTEDLNNLNLKAENQQKIWIILNQPIENCNYQEVFDNYLKGYSLSQFTQFYNIELFEYTK